VGNAEGHPDRVRSTWPKPTLFRSNLRALPLTLRALPPRVPVWS
jgi:hypothetical protein